MSIYTKTGDRGMTSLASGERVRKTDARIESYGTADELSSLLGWLAVALQEQTDASVQVAWVQQRLFNIGASLSGAQGEWVSEADVHQLEEWIDRMMAVVPPLRAFVLPAGSEAVCRCHVCRTVCRRLERLMCALEGVEETELKYVNRLSDYLFTLARYIEVEEGGTAVIWKKDAEV